MFPRTPVFLSLSAGLFQKCPHLSCSAVPKTAHNPPGEVWSRKDSRCWESIKPLVSFPSIPEPDVRYAHAEMTGRISPTWLAEKPLAVQSVLPLYMDEIKQSWVSLTQPVK